jgi:hypothetical protein
MRKLLLVPVIVLFSCSHNKSHTPMTAQELAAHRRVWSELDSHKARLPAEVVRSNLEGLERLSPGKFEVYVFPKINTQNHKDADNEEYLGRPQVHEVSVQAIAPCKRLVDGMFSKYKPESAFAPGLKDDAKAKCAILLVTNRTMAQMDKALLRPDDQKAVRVFLDDRYQIHAIDFIIYESPNVDRISRIKGDGGSVSAPLSFFPILMPGADAKFRPTNLKSAFEKQLDPIAVYQIKKRLAKSFVAPDCKGHEYEFSDPVGGKVRGGWCDELPWPSYQENDRFFSVSQPLSVR